MGEKQITNKELYDYFWKIFLDGNSTKEQKAAMFNARQLWHQFEDNIYEKYGKGIVAPSNICDTSNPFTIHFTWDDDNDLERNVLGCSINENQEVYICFCKSIWVKENLDSSCRADVENWAEYLILPDIEMPERLRRIFYQHYLKKNNGH